MTQSMTQAIMQPNLQLSIQNLSRRRFIKTSALAGGGLILGMYLPGLSAANVLAEPLQEAANNGAGAKDFEPNAFVHIARDGAITVLVNHSEMGQGCYTALPMMVAEELDADWSRVRPIAAPVSPVYNHTMYGAQMTGGSTSVRSEWERVRKAGASARAMFVTAAAAMWGVDPAACRTEKSMVIDTASNRSISYGELVEAASKLTPPQDVPLKDPKDYRIIGKPTHRLDTPSKVNGTAQFGIDVQLPGMLVAVIARPPTFSGKLKRFDATKTKAVPGVRHVIEIPRGIAIVADGYWPAHKGRLALDVEWDDGDLATLNSDTQLEQYQQLSNNPGPVARNEGDAMRAMEAAPKKIAATYQLPYLAHATMEPLNCVADVKTDSCHVYTGTQFQTGDWAAALQETGLKPEQVHLHTTMLGGGFGRRAVIDSHFVREAVQISKAVKVPIKVIWSREDDMAGGYYRPAAFHSIAAALDVDDKPVAWWNRIVCQSFMAGTPFEAVVVRNGIDDTAVEGAYDIVYDIPNIRVEWNQAPGGVPTLWWRSVGHSHTGFVVESFMDELAHKAGKDPLEFRRSLLAKHPRRLAVLELAASKAGWGKTLPPGHAMGLAVHESFASIVAYVVEASVSDVGEVRVHRVVGAIDCGRTVNPDTIHAQMDSGVTFGLTAALYGAITFENGRVQQRNFHDYKMLRMHEMPVVESHIVESVEALGGVGEPCVPPVAPALCNAIFAATGKRVRSLPLSRHDLSWS